MKRVSGPSRKLTNAQIRIILRWSEERQRFLRTHGSAHSIARRLGLSVYVVRRWLRTYKPNDQQKHRKSLGAKSGRPPIIRTRAARAALRRWIDASRHYRATHVSAAALARDLGVSRFTIFDCIQRRGRYAHDYSAVGGPRTTGRNGGQRKLSRRERQELAAAERTILLSRWAAPSTGTPLRSSRKRRSQ
jgi:hypothetical protein